MIHTPVINGYITSAFDEKRVSNGKEIIHGGLDVGSKKQPCQIYNTHTGIIHASGWSETYGFRVWVKVKNDLYIVYGHLQSISENAKLIGTKINSSDQIGIMGDTGYSKGVHLHYGWSTLPTVNGKKLKPVEIENMLIQNIVKI